MKALTTSLVTLILIGAVFPSLSYGQFKEYRGSGDDVLIIEKPNNDLPALLVIGGNSGSAHFSVTSYDDSRDYLDLLVNTSDPYSGIVALDLPVGTHTKMLEITATGSWTVSVYSIGAATKISTSAALDGSGDTVLWIMGNASLARISGNSSQQHFSVTAYDENGGYGDLLVNTSDSYSGTVMIPKNTLLLSVNAVGDWSIKLR